MTEIQSNEKFERGSVAFVTDASEYFGVAKTRGKPKPYRPRTGASAPALPVYIREWRLYKSMTQDRVADIAQMSISSISNLENGITGVSDRNLAALAHAYNCNIADLFRNPLEPDYQLWRIIVGMKPEQREQALRVVRALAGEAA